MKICVICKTRYQKGSGITFHKFPSDFIQKQWLKKNKLNLLNWNPKTNNYVCCKHFTNESLTKHSRNTTLKKFSVPTIFFDSDYCESRAANDDYCESSAADDDEQQTLDNIHNDHSYFKEPPQKELIEWDTYEYMQHKDGDNVPEVGIFSWQKPGEGILDSDNEEATAPEENLSLFCQNDDKGLAVVKDDVTTHGGKLDNGYVCNFCHGPITWFHYRCVQCADCDLCARCEAAGRHLEHYVLRIPQDRPRTEVLSMLSRIRSQLLGGENPLLAGDVTNDLPMDGVKMEVKEEEEQCEPDPLWVEEAQPWAESVERARPHQGNAAVTDTELPAETINVQKNVVPQSDSLSCKNRWSKSQEDFSDDEPHVETRLPESDVDEPVQYVISRNIISNRKRKRNYEGPKTKMKNEYEINLNPTDVARTQTTTYVKQPQYYNDKNKIINHYRHKK